MKKSQPCPPLSSGCLWFVYSVTSTSDDFCRLSGFEVHSSRVRDEDSILAALHEGSDSPAAGDATSVPCFDGQTTNKTHTKCIYSSTVFVPICMPSLHCRHSRRHDKGLREEARW